MIKLPEIPLPAEALHKLAAYQGKIDEAGDYAAQVASAKKKFSSYNKIGNKTFDKVKEKLLDMCTGVRRCAYCEDSVADEVEHIQPKDLYPEVTFNWDNYLYACGPCNGPKNNNWAVFSAVSGQLTEVQRSLNDPVTPPEAGDHVFINPRTEDPLTFMMLDLRETFRFAPIKPQGTIDYERTEYTIRILRLNSREEMVEAREVAFENFISLLGRYINKRKAGAAAPVLQRTISALRRNQHRTVWMEMIRQREAIPELKELFDQAPEALNWV